MSTVLDRAKAKKDEIMARLRTRFPIIPPAPAPTPAPIAAMHSYSVIQRIRNRPLMRKVISPQYAPALERKFITVPPHPGLPPTISLKTTNEKIMV